MQALLEDLKRSLDGIRSHDDFKNYGRQYMMSKYDIPVLPIFVDMLACTTYTLLF